MGDKKLIITPAEKWVLWTSPSGKLYRVSNRGVVHRQLKSGKWKKTGGAIQSTGYHNFGGETSKSGKWGRLVHRLVAELFIPNPDNLPEVDHRDRNRKNNRVENLRWTTHKHNCQNTVGRGCFRHGKRWSASIRVDGQPKYLGMYDTEEEAHAAYLAAKKVMHPFFTGE